MLMFSQNNSRNFPTRVKSFINNFIKQLKNYTQELIKRILVAMDKKIYTPKKSLIYLMIIIDTLKKSD